MILIGDVMEQLQTLPDESVQCVVTSPPYWGLRDYGVAGQLGLEKTPEEYIAKMVEVFQEVKRVLRKDGTLWLNMGDSYAGSYKGRNSDGSPGPGEDAIKHKGASDGNLLKIKNPPGLKPKDLIGVPWRVALALQSDGWWLRCDIIWSKPNPMPESVTDRPTKSHEYIFLLSKSAKYYYDAEAIKTEATESTIQRISQATFGQQTGGPKDPIHGGEGSRNRSARKGLEGLKDKFDRTKRVPSGWNVNHDESNLKGRYPQKKQDALDLPTYTGFNDRYEPPLKVNRRSVWEIPTQTYPEAHFATFPEMIPRLCILAGTSSKGCCGKCGAPWKRIIEKKFVPQDDVSEERGKRDAAGNKSMDHRNDGNLPRGTNDNKTLNWQPSCSCDADVIPCTVLDPFLGSGTTGLVAQNERRDWIGIELNPEYAEMARKRTMHKQELLNL